MSMAPPPPERHGGAGDTELDTAALEEHVRCLYGNRAGAGTGWVALHPHFPQRKPSVRLPRRWHHTTEADLGAGIVEDYYVALERYGPCGAFVNINPYREPPAAGKRGGASLVDWVSVMFADLDSFDPVHHADPNLPSLGARLELLDLLGDGIIRPSWYVETGAGLQPCWRLAEPWPADVARRTLAAIRAKFHTVARDQGQTFDEECTTDLARLGRLAGTFNTKSTAPRLTRLVRPEPLYDTRIYGPEPMFLHAADFIRFEVWERCLYPRPTSPSPSSRWSTFQGPDPLEEELGAHEMLDRLVDEGWTIEREYVRDDDLCWSLIRPGKGAGTSANVREFADGHATFWCFSNDTNAEPFEPNQPYRARAFLTALDGTAPRRRGHRHHRRSRR